MKFKPALTLVELLIVIGLIAVLSVPVIFSIPKFRNNQALMSSGESLSDVLRTARIFSRGEKDDRAWGVRYENNGSYQLISSSPDLILVEKIYTLNKPAVFPGYFDNILFERTSGNLKQPVSIEIEVPSGKRGFVTISKTGIVKYTNE